MGIYKFGENRGQVLKANDIAERPELLRGLAEYLVRERRKEKIPLIIAGAGTSATNVDYFWDASSPSDTEKKLLRRETLEAGLPCLHDMISQLKGYVDKEAGEGLELQELKRLFGDMTDTMENIDREWLGKVFGFFGKTADAGIQNIWKKFCDWFFFQCIKNPDPNKGRESYGALNTKTSATAQEIAKTYGLVDAICLSANFDNYIDGALEMIDANRKGISVFDSELAEKYFKRNRRGSKAFEDAPYNRCVIHANGDVFWLYCNGKRGEGYCPQEGMRRPAFSYGSYEVPQDLICPICGSPLEAVMTMPGTYEKDYNTRAIITTIWKYISTKISCVITVGLSCNWDDVLLKFILQLLCERDIPLLDINNFSDKAKNGKTELVEKIIKGSQLETCCLNMAADEGMKLLNEEIKKCCDKRSEEAQLDDDFKEQLRMALEQEPEIIRLKQVSQLGLKSFWMDSIETNDRWSHSVQVADTASQMYLKMAENSCKKTSSFEQVLLYSAGLLHDCGHLPFSHLLEDVFEELAWHLKGEAESFEHGHYTKWVIHSICSRKDSQVRKVLDKYGVHEDEIINLIEGKYGLNYMDVLINSAIDADKIAYIFTDAEKMNKALSLKKEDFIKELLEEAYITQEGLVALDGKSAWYAMKLLDERKRLYEELYYDTRIRCLESAAKYIVTTYFVQKYNKFGEYTEDERTERSSDDMGHSHILDAIQDLFSMIDGSDYKEDDLSASVGEQAGKGIDRCMQLILRAKMTSLPECPDEIEILKKMYKQLRGSEPEEPKEKEDLLNYSPYSDEQLIALVNLLSYENLSMIRKKIILNYPGTVLIDIFKSARYFSSPRERRKHSRLDGTNAVQEMILVPASGKEQWTNQNSLAEIGLSEYAEKNRFDAKGTTVFHIFKVGQDEAFCEHVINMIKKEMEAVGR